jgi:hypothetical protein
MMTSRDHTSNPALISLDAAATAARSGFACMFSSSDEYETALIAQRRAQGRYGLPKRRGPLVAFVSTCMAIVATVAVYFARS